MSDTNPAATPDHHQVLLVDDDEKLVELLARFLADHPFDLHAKLTPSAGLKWFDDHQPDIVILDVMLPEMDGFDVCRELRKRDASVPIIMLTARGDVTDRIVGLEMGADDYLPKPFSPRELIARMKALLRRAQPRSSDSKRITIGDITFDRASRRVTLRDNELRMTSTELEILELMMSGAGKSLSRDDIMHHVSGTEVGPFDRSIDVHVSNLRRKLEDDPSNPKYILTVWGTGYRFVEPHA